MNIVITGGAGYIGTELIYKLIPEKNVTGITVYDNLSRHNFNLFLHPYQKCNKIRFIRGDILDSRKLKNTFKNTDIVFHLAARVSTPFANEDPHLFDQVNNWGTAELTYVAENSAVKTLIYVSSASVYGSSDRMCDESTPPNPDTIYGISKFNGEKHVNRVSGKMKTVILRCANVYGYSPGMRFDAVINRFMFEANYYRKISVHGNGEQTRAFVPVEITAQVLAWAVRDKLPAGTYNLVDKNLSVGEITGTVREIFPDTETLFINQNIALRQQKIRTDCGIKKFFPWEPKPLKDELVAFKNKFAF
ncbi:MAG: SDR family oxidoreductase [Bacteroidetes bacterium]|nr:SDR family oxidoreductase [Bacteroidota bacterium]